MGLEFIPNQKNKPSLLVYGYLLNQYRVNGDETVTWRCNEYCEKIKCRSSVRNGDGKIIKEPKPHAVHPDHKPYTTDR
jgi:hypothetical protein